MSKIKVDWRDDFDSVSALCARASAPLTGVIATGRNDEPSKWNGDVTLDGAVKLATHGWKVGRERWASKYVADFSGYVTPAPRVTYDVAGAFPDVARAIAGEPACFADHGDDGQHKPIVSVVVNISASAVVSGQVIENRGLALVAAIDQAEARGARVELSACVALASFDNRAYAATIVIKPAGQPVDLDLIAFTLSHPAMFRRLVFNAIETHAGKPLSVLGYCYGTPSDLHEHIAPGSIYFPALKGSGADHYATPDKAFGYVNQLIQRAIEVKCDD